jgi:hypothetical protein
MKVSLTAVIVFALTAFNKRSRTGGKTERAFAKLNDAAGDKRLTG